MSREDSQDFSQATSQYSVMCIALKSKTPGLKICRWKGVKRIKNLFDKQLQYELWQFLLL